MAHSWRALVDGFWSRCRGTFARERNQNGGVVTVPARGRLPEDDVWRRVVIAAHDAAVEAGERGYIDPVTGLFVMTFEELRSNGSCCSSGCRHCPFVERETDVD